MTKNEQATATIGNAGAIIARFGGIRPMASKVRVPVTTVQGWKKRDAIPVTRLEQIRAAAREHKIELGDMLGTFPVANENQVEETYVTEARVVEPAKTETQHSPKSFHHFKTEAMKDGEEIQQEKVKEKTRAELGLDVRASSNARPQGAAPVYEDLAKKLAEAERKAVRKSVFVSLVLLAMTAGLATLLFWPQSPISREGRHMAALEEKVARLRVDVANVRKERNNNFSGIAIPADLEQKISDLQQQVKTVSATATQAATQAVAQATTAAQTNEMFGPMSNEVEQRIAKLESQISGMTGISMAGVMDRFMAMQASPEGQQQITVAWRSLSELAVMLKNNGTTDFNAALQTAKTQNPSLATALDGVLPQDLQDAAALFAMSQVRASLGLESAPLNSDLQALKILAVANPDVVQAVDSFLPVAGSSIPSAPTLSAQLDSLSSSIVNASLQNAGVTERAKARLGQVLQIEKDGQLISGTPAQAKIAGAKTLLAQGDVMGALAQMQTLDAQAVAAAQPWMTQANTAMLAQQLKNTLTRTINMRAYGRGGVTTMDAPIISSPANLYKPAQIQP